MQEITNNNIVAIEHYLNNHKEILSCLRDSRKHPEKMNVDFKDKACSKDICATMPRLKNDWSDANTRYEYQEGHNIPLPPNLEEFLVILMETQNYLEAGRWQKIRPLQAWQHTRHLQNQGYIRSFHIYPAREESKCH